MYYGVYDSLAETHGAIGPLEGIPLESWTRSFGQTPTPVERPLYLLIPIAAIAGLIYYLRK